MLAAPAPRASAAELILDLRIAGSGSKAATVSTATGNNTVNLELFALVLDPNLTASDTGFNATQGAWKSSAGGMLGNLSTSLLSPFNDSSGSQNPAPVDLDGDGDLDVGANASSSSGFWIASSGSSGVFTADGTETIGGSTYRRFKIGTGTFTATSFNPAGTTINYVARTGDALVHPHKYFKDSTSVITSVNGTDSRLQIGNPASAGVAISVAGINYTWTGSSTAWNLASSWGGVGVPNSAADTATIASGTNATVNLGGSRAVGAITFNRSSPLQVTDSSPSTFTINNGTGAGTITQSGGAPVTFGGIVSVAASALTTSVTAAPLQINSAITASSLTKTGGNSLILGGSPGNTIASTVISAGTIEMNKPFAVNALGGSIAVNSGGTLLWDADEQIADSASLTLNSGGTINLNGHTETITSFTDNGGNTILGGGSLIVTAGDVTLSDGSTLASATTLAAGLNYIGTTTAATVSGNLTLASIVASHTFNIADGAASADVNITGVISGGSGITKTGPGTVRFAPATANTYNGPTTVNAGTLQLAAGAGPAMAGSLTIGSGGTVVLQASNQFTNATDLTVVAGGTLSYAGAFAQSIDALSGGGTINFASGASLTAGSGGDSSAFSGALSGPGDFTWNGSGTLTLTGVNALSGTLAVRTGTVVIASTANPGSADILIGNGGALRADGDFSASNSITRDGSIAGTIDVTAGHTLTLTGSVDYDASASGPLIKSGAGTLAVSGSAPGPLDMPLNVNAGALSFTGGRALDAGARAVTVAAGATLDLAGSAPDPVVGSLAGGGNILLGSRQLTVGGDNTSTNFAGAFSGSSAKLVKNGAGTLTLTGASAIGSQLIVTGGTVGITGAGNVAVGGTVTVQPSSSAATLNVTSGGMLAADSFVVQAGDGFATLNISDATVNATTQFEVGAVGTGIFNVNAGGILDASSAIVKVFDTGTSSIHLNGGTIRAGELHTGGNPARFNWTSGTLQVTDFGVDSGAALGNNLTIDAGKTLALVHNADVGSTSSGSLTVSGGGIVTSIGGAAPSPQLRIGDAASATGIVNVTGSGSSWSVDNAVELQVGHLGTGTMNITAGGAVTTAANATVANQAGSAGTLSVSGAGSHFTSSGSVFIGGSTTTSGGGGSLNVSSGGDASIAGTLKIWNGASSLIVNNAAVSAGGLQLNGGVNTIGAGGVLTVGASGIATSGGGIILSPDPNVPGTVRLNGNVISTATSGTVQFASGVSFPGSVDGTIDLVGGTRTFDIANGSAATDMIVGARIINGALTKSGPGNLALANANDYAGATTITGGTLTVARSGAIPAASALNMSGGSTLNLQNFTTTVTSLSDSAASLNHVNIDAGGSLTFGDVTSTTFHGDLAGGGALVKTGTATAALTGAVGLTGGVTVNLGTLVLGSANPALGGAVAITGTGPTWGTLEISSDANLGAANLSLAGGHLRTDGSFTLTRTIALGVGGGAFEIDSNVTVAGSLTGAGGFTKTGGGTLKLSTGVSTYLGQTSIDNGILSVESGATLPSTTDVSIASGAFLDLLNSQTIGSLRGSGGTLHLLSSSTLTVGGNNATTDFTGSISGNGSLVKSGSGTMTYTGPLDLGSGSVTVTAGTLALNPTSGGSFSGGLVVQSGGTLSLASANNLGPSSIKLQNGTLQTTATFTSAQPVDLGISGSGTFDVASATTLTQTGALQGNGQIIKSGAGTMILSSQPGSTFNGTISAKQGTLLIDSTAQMPAVSGLAVAAGAVIQVDKPVGNPVATSASLNLDGGSFRATGAADLHLGSLVVNSGASTLELQQPSGGNGKITFSLGAAHAMGATLDVTAFDLGVTNQIILSGQPAGFMGSWITINGADFAKYNTDLGVRPLAPADYTSTFAPAANVKLTASPAPIDNVSINTLNLDTSSNAVNVAINAGQNLNLAGGGLLKSGFNAASITGGSLTSSGGPSGGSLAVFASGAGGLTIDSQLTGLMDLYKAGAGTLVLTNTNSFSGTVFASAGTLRIASDANLGAAGNDVVLNGATLQITAPISFGGGRSFNFTSAALDLAGGDATFAADDQIAGTFTKTGVGTLAISGSNHTSGVVTVAQGALRLGNTAALGVSSGSKSRINLQPGATLDLRSDGPYPANFGNDIVVADNTPAAPATITTGRITTPPVTAGVFQLGSLRIGSATLATGGTAGSLEFTGVTTLTGAAVLDTARDARLSGIVTGGGSLNKKGSATLTIGGGPSDTAGNTYAGQTIITGGVLQLDKAPGTIAIPGNITLSGGTLVLLSPRQIADSSVLSLGGGTFDLNGQSNSLATLNNTGANVIVNGGTLTVGTSSIDGGTTTIGAPPSAPHPSMPMLGGFPPTPSATSTVYNSAYKTDSLSMSDGTTTVNPGGSLDIGAGGLTFTGSSNPTITLVADAANPGRVTLAGDVTNNCTGGTAQVVNSGSPPTAGTIDLLAASRTFTVASTASDLKITSRITNGSLRKSGSGNLVLSGVGSDYSLGTTIALGAIDAMPGTLGTGPVTLAGGDLILRSDLATAKWSNDLSTSDATVTLARVSAGTTGTLQMNRLTIGSSRLRVAGADGGTLEFTAGATLTGAAVFENFTTLQFSGAITGGTNTLTKDSAGGTLVFSGSAANTYTGQTTVNAGKLQLSKSAGVTAIAGNLAVFTGGSVEWLASDQVADTSALVINGSTSSMNLNGNNDTVAGVTMTAGTLSTGAGKLTLAGNLTTNISAATATINGNLDIGAVNRTFTVADGTPADDLVINAAISGSAAIVKAGNGTMVLNGNNSFTGGVTITAGTVKTPGPTSVSGAVPFSVTTGSLDLPGAFTAADGTTITKTGGGSLIIRGAQTYGNNVQLLAQQGAVTLGSDAGGASPAPTSASSGGKLAVTASTSTTFDQSQHLKSLSIASGATVTLSANGSRVINTDSFVLAGATGAWTAKLQLSDNDLIVHSSGATRLGDIATITNQIKTGFNLAGGTFWTGNGITSSAAAGDSAHFRAVGVISNDATAIGLTGLLFTSFDGQPVDANSILVKSTYFGDADLSGSITSNDYFQIDTGFLAGRSGWINGDFDYDGAVTSNDYFVIDSAFLGQTGALSPPPLAAATSEAALAGVSEVPEPGTTGLLSLAAGGALLRRRRRPPSRAFA